MDVADLRRDLSADGCCLGETGPYGLLTALPFV